MATRRGVKGYGGEEYRGDEETRSSENATSCRPTVTEADTSDLTDDEYHELSDESMDTLHEGLEALVEDFGPPEWEVEYSVSLLPSAKCEVFVCAV